MKTYRLYTYDVKKKKKDGYEVNDVFKTSELYSFDEKLSDEKLIKEL